MVKLVTRPHDKSINHGPDIPESKILGPFPGDTTPSHIGPYKRKSPKTGKRLWSYWNGRQWGMMGKNFKRALERKNKPSKVQSGLEWWGYAG